MSNTIVKPPSCFARYFKPKTRRKKYKVCTWCINVIVLIFFLTLYIFSCSFYLSFYTSTLFIISLSFSWLLHFLSFSLYKYIYITVLEYNIIRKYDDIIMLLMVVFIYVINKRIYVLFMTIICVLFEYKLVLRFYRIKKVKNPQKKSK